jgi:MFS family permease
VAISAVVAGRLVARLGRRLTVAGPATTVAGLAAVALVLRHVQGDRAAWAAAGPLLLAGLGGGMVTSPNVTLTLQSVPVRMAGAASGALQTAQRIGAAIGTALLVSVFYRLLTGSGHAWTVAVSDTLLCACGLMLLALLLAVGELSRRRRDRPRAHAGAQAPPPSFRVTAQAAVLSRSGLGSVAAGEVVSPSKQPCAQAHRGDRRSSSTHRCSRRADVITGSRYR